MSTVKTKKKRRDSNQICIDLKSERSILYKKRSRVVKKQQSGKLSKKAFDVSERLLKRINAKIDSLSVKLFRCGKKYALFKNKRMNLIKRVSKLKVELLGNRDMVRSERNKKLTQLSELNQEIRVLSELMGKQLIEQKSGKVDFVRDDEQGLTNEDVVIWEVINKVEGLLKSNMYKFLDVFGDLYSLEISQVSALWAVDDFVAEITASQRNRAIKTPMVRITTNNITNTITLQSI